MLPALLALLAFLPLAALAAVTISRASYEGADHFVVQTPAATYWYDIAGGGLSRLIDPDGNDWIGFRRHPWNQTPHSAASSYRGLPNFVFGSADSGAGHPGFSHCVTVASGNIILTTSRSGHWRWVWTFFDDHARVTLERAGTPGYWFLYEGIPGGAYSPSTWYWGNDQFGPSRRMPDFLAGQRVLSRFRWAYFGHQRAPRVLFVAQLEADDIPDSFAVMGNSSQGISSPDGMVVFGFGRAQEPKPLLTHVPQTFLLGLHPRPILSVQDHAALARRIHELCSPLPLAIRLFYGNQQHFGALGVPQRFVNLLGRVEGAARSLLYRLNGGPTHPLTLGPNDTRLAAPGDFNVEIDYRALRPGPNHLELIAADAAANQVRQTLTVHFTPNRFWPLPYEIDWSRVSRIPDAAQIVDGEWLLTPNGVRTLRPYYDRILALGDLNWRDYDVIVEVTFHGFTPPHPGPPTYNVSHAGIGLRWQGHQDDGQQPRVQWYPLGAAAEFQLFPDLSQCHWRILPGRDAGPILLSAHRLALQLNRKYLLRAKVESEAAGQARYRVKIWPSDEPEPPAWAAELCKPAFGFQHGSLLLVAHNTDVTFGRLRVTPP